VHYQKQLRLAGSATVDASRHVDGSQAANLVGYHSVSKFSREYSRAFGAPPQRDVPRMRSR